MTKNRLFLSDTIHSYFGQDQKMVLPAKRVTIWSAWTTCKYIKSQMDLQMDVHLFVGGCLEKLSPQSRELFDVFRLLSTPCSLALFSIDFAPDENSRSDMQTFSIGHTPKHNSHNQLSHLTYSILFFLVRSILNNNNWSS